jgi:hypothetical protein
MGGLVSRAYLEESSWYMSDVDSVFMLGTPNGGAGLVTLPLLFYEFIPEMCSWQPAACEFSLPGMAIWNLQHFQRAPAVRYYLIAGTKGRWDLFGLIPNDGLVTVWSVHLIYYFGGGQVDKTTVDATHSTFFYTSTIAYDSHIRPYLPNSVAVAQRLPAPVAAAGTVEPVVSASTAAIRGTITTGQTYTYTMDVDNAGQSAFILSWLTGTLSLSLTTPGGVPVTPSSAAVDPNVDYVTATNWVNSAAYTFTTTQTGPWTLAVHGEDTGGAAVPFVAWAALSSTLQLTLPDYALAYPMSQPLLLTTTLTADGVGQSGATVQATLARPDGVTDTLPLFDDGAHGDGTASDGVYGNTYAVPHVSGYYVIRTTATGMHSGVPFSRQAQSAFMVAADTAALAGTYTDYPVDTNDNGFYEYLAVDTGLQVTEAGTYTLSAWLVGAGDTPIAQATHYITLSTGVQTATLQFDGGLIRDSGLDGPYTVTEVYLVDSRGAPVLADTGTNVWVTPAYDHWRFGTPYTLYLPLVLRDY